VCERGRKREREGERESERGRERERVRERLSFAGPFVFSSSIVCVCERESERG